MGEPAKAFWIEDEEEIIVPEAQFEDIALLSTGETDDAWKFGSD